MQSGGGAAAQAEPKVHAPQDLLGRERAGQAGVPTCARLRATRAGMHKRAAFVHMQRVRTHARRRAKQAHSTWPCPPELVHAGCAPKQPPLWQGWCMRCAAHRLPPMQCYTLHQRLRRLNPTNHVAQHTHTHTPEGMRWWQSPAQPPKWSLPQPPCASSEGCRHAELWHTY